IYRAVDGNFLGRISGCVFSTVYVRTLLERRYYGFGMGVLYLGRWHNGFKYAFGQPILAD
ncbi:MAG: hypothetical protein J6Y13_01985, partial [Treponema sp.]|nr:hypothetical protein [Treponema sp.]